MMKNNLLFFLLLIFSTGLYADTKPLVPELIPDVSLVSAEEVIELIYSAPELVIIDARKQQEYNKGHIEGAISILDTYMTEEDLEKNVPSRTHPVVFYCNGTRCMRSHNAIIKARQWGYTNLYWFRGGWKEWQGAKLPIVAGEYQYPDKSQEH